MEDESIYVLKGELERRQAVIDYIKNHPGCTFAEIDRLQGHDRGIIPARSTLSKILNYLKSKESGRIIFEKSAQDRRDKYLYVTKNHPFVTVPNEIDEFGQIFEKFIDKLVEYP